MADDEIIRQGKALVRAIQGLQALDDTAVTISVIESHERQGLIKIYQRELKKIIAILPKEHVGEILLAMKNADLPANDPHLN